ncbi:CZB domain-containing protein [Planctomyces sp. SH-PL62]|uniref:CZB domain-containing protein n=1 Tax=Planctomyces sp. SH-PL62 TaxID=1636152 RepID=UPI00078EA0F9|nr:CZB domain-containing protein [Planctomyces sp. SH-PL62]AMV39853.1 diguanylate cyclase [Planctomyces sp. SH-PL62]
MIDPASLDHAIAAHAKWKFRLREAINTGQSEWTVEKVRPDDQCEFGKWLNSLPLPDRMRKEWREVKVLHAGFHAAAADVLASALAGRQSEAAAAIAPGGAFADVSTKLVRLITEWKKTAAGPQAR